MRYIDTCVIFCQLEQNDESTSHLPNLAMWLHVIFKTPAISGHRCFVVVGKACSMTEHVIIALSPRSSLMKCQTKAGTSYLVEKIRWKSSFRKWVNLKVFEMQMVLMFDDFWIYSKNFAADCTWGIFGLLAHQGRSIQVGRTCLYSLRVCTVTETHDSIFFGGRICVLWEL